MHFKIAICAGWKCFANAADSQNSMGTISCDDGRTWVSDRAVENSNDDHGEYSARGLAYGQNTFVINVGWGKPGKVRRSEDGVAWQQTLGPMNSAYADIAYGAGAFVISGATNRAGLWTEG